MRDSNRIYPIMCHIAEKWQEKCPDWRFGQIMSNFFSAYGDPFYWEDNKLIEYFDKFIENEVR